MAKLLQLIDDVVANTFTVDTGITSIGRHPDNSIQIDEGSVSGRHAQLSVSANPDFPEYIECHIEDLGSTNGTLVNGEAIAGKVLLHHGDKVSVAYNQFRFDNDSEAPLAKTMHILK